MITKPRKNPRIPRYTVQLVRESTVNIEEYTTISNSAAAAIVARKIIGSTDREMFIVVSLDMKNKIIGANVVSIGSQSSSVVHPREVFKMLVIQSAAAFVCFHNHPSGDPTPSREDREVTARLMGAAKMMGIRMLDHIVLGETDQFSFADAGLLQ